MLLILEPIVPEFHPIPSKIESRGGGPPGEEPIDTFLAHLEPMMGGGLVTLERARVIRSKQVIARKRFAH